MQRVLGPPVPQQRDVGRRQRDRERADPPSRGAIGIRERGHPSPESDDRRDADRRDKVRAGGHRYFRQPPESGGVGPVSAGPFRSSESGRRRRARRALYGQSLSVAVKVILPLAES